MKKLKSLFFSFLTFRPEQNACSIVSALDAFTAKQFTRHPGMRNQPFAPPIYIHSLHPLSDR